MSKTLGFMQRSTVEVKGKMRFTTEHRDTFKANNLHDAPVSVRCESLPAPTRALKFTYAFEREGHTFVFEETVYIDRNGNVDLSGTLWYELD